MKTFSAIAAVCILTFQLAAQEVLAVQEVKVDRDVRYLLLATNRTGTMQKELNAAAAQGFRVVTAMHGGDEAILILERPRGHAEPYEYRMLATQRSSTMEKELNEAGRDGFRFVPQTAFEKGDEGLLVVERVPNSAARYEYRLLATHRTSTLEKELNEAANEGFVLKGSFSRDEKMAVLERSSER